MAENLPNIPLTPNTWVDLYAASGITPGVAIAVENLGSIDIYLSSSTVEPSLDDIDGDGYNVLRRDSEVLRNSDGDIGAWAYCQSVGGKVAVREATTNKQGFFPEVSELTVENATITTERTAIIAGPFQRSGPFLSTDPVWVSAIIDWHSTPWKDYTQGFYAVTATSGSPIQVMVKLESSENNAFPVDETDVKYFIEQVTNVRRFPFGYYGLRYQRVTILPPTNDLTKLVVSSAATLNLARSTPRLISDDLTFDSHADWTVASALFGELPDGKYKSALLSQGRALITELDGVTVTPSGALHTEGVIDYVNLSFDVENGERFIEELQAVPGSVGTYVIDTVNGGLVTTCPATPGSEIHIETIRRVPYSENTGHAMLQELTIGAVVDAGLVGQAGDGRVEFGLGKYIAGEFDGFGFGADPAGLYTFLIKKDNYIFKTYQPTWNFDQMLGGEFSKFLRDNVPEAITLNLLNLFRIEGEFLFAAEQIFKVKRPTGKLLLANAQDFPNSQIFTSLRSADLPVFIRARNDSIDGGIIQMLSGSLRGSVFSNRTVSAGKNPDGDIVDTPAPGTHSENVTYIPLIAAPLTWDGGFKKVTEYSDAQATVLSDVTGTIYPIGSTDGVTDNLPLDPIIYNTPGVVVQLSVPASPTYFRWQFVADAVQTVFLFEGKFLLGAPGTSTIPAAGNVGKGVPAIPTHSLLKYYDGTKFIYVDADTRRLPIASQKVNLESRMLAFEAAQGYTMWFDVEDLNYFYLMEAPVGSVSTDTGFRGIRIPKSLSGAPLGGIEINTQNNLTWDTRTTHGGWSA